MKPDAVGLTPPHNNAYVIAGLIPTIAVLLRSFGARFQMIRLPIVHISLRDFETVEANITTN